MSKKCRKKSVCAVVVMVAMLCISGCGSGKIKSDKVLRVGVVTYTPVSYTHLNLVQITDECDRFCRWAYRIMGAVVTAGVGTTCESLYGISTSYEGAREAVSYRVLYGTKRAINIGAVSYTHLDGHAPRRMTKNGPCPVKKIVVKVKL